MATFEGEVEFQGNPLTLEGNRVDRGMDAPNFRVNRDLQEIVEFDEVKGDKVYILTSALSVDTSVCAGQLYEFDRRIAELQNTDVEGWFISRDLPFALQRHVEDQDIQKINTMSDYQFREFGDNYGLTIREFDLLARATIVVDKEGKVVYKEVVSEATNEPDYNAAINAAKTASQNA